VLVLTIFPETISGVFEAKWLPESHQSLVELGKLEVEEFDLIVVLIRDLLLHESSIFFGATHGMS
jgi:hypothetical protein